MSVPKDVGSAATEPEEEPDEPTIAREIKFGEDSKFQQISINISFPFSSIVVPAGRRMSGGLFEFVRKAVPARVAPKVATDKEETESRPQREVKRPAA